MNEGKQELQVRLAIRGEGEYINAYFADRDSMDDAVLLGSLKRSIVNTDKNLFDQWREFMQLAFGRVAADVIGVELEWGEPHTAPEHERSGSA